MTKAIRRGLKIDTFLQGTALIGMAGSAIAALLFNHFIFALTLCFIAFLGILQVSSALVFGWALRDTNTICSIKWCKRRGMYLLGVLGFFGSYFSLAIIEVYIKANGLLSIVQALLGISILALAIRYFSITIQDMVRCNIR